MKTQKQLHEDVPVTTTNNNGQGLESPKLPIKKDSLVRRYKSLIQRKTPAIK